MKLSLVVDNIIYKECCRNKKCKNCEFYTKEYNCNIAYIIKIIEEYEKRFNI